MRRVWAKACVRTTGPTPVLATNSVDRQNQTHAATHNICRLCVLRRQCPVVPLSLRLKRESELQVFSRVPTPRSGARGSVYIGRVWLQTEGGHLCNGAEAWEGARGGWVYEENVGSGLGGGRAGVGI